MPVLLVLLAASPVLPSLEAGTAFPVLVGGRVSVELPLRLRASLTGGVMPEPYLDATQGVLVAAGAYDQTTAAIIEAALKNALLLRLQVGWRPVLERGFYFELGYGFAGLGGGLTGAELVTATTGKTLPAETARLDVQASAIVHQFTLELGWQWFLWRGLFLRAAIGGFLSLAATTNLQMQNVPTRLQPQVDLVLVAGEQYLTSTITTSVHAPMLSLSVGYELFR